MPVRFLIPADGYATRGPGDPEVPEAELALPTTLYLYAVTEPVAGEPVITQPPSPITLSADSWQRVTGDNDDVYYQYYQDIQVPLPDNIPAENRKAIRVYAAVSPVALENLSAANSEDDIRNLTVDLPDDGQQYKYIKDIYATPADYLDGGEYYGSVPSPTDKTPTVALTLYHVAAKMDIIWNVAADLRQDVRLRQLQFRNLRSKGCLLFRPMHNTQPPSSTYQVTVTPDIGSQWMGRYVFYAMPYRQGSVMPLEVHLWQDGDTSDNGHSQTIDIQMAETVFAPWIRQDLTINKLLNGQ